jgi:hypothetical protein
MYVQPAAYQASLLLQASARLHAASLQESARITTSHSMVAIKLMINTFNSRGQFQVLFRNSNVAFEPNTVLWL